ncbi:MAG: arginyltransferase [Planctomycetes bacterium]|nr:arginyltransferase [Planctomycetota bacterium]
MTGGASDNLQAFVASLPLQPQRPCNYLPGKVARERAFLAEHVDAAIYHDLMDLGFRRSGQVFYAMACPDCAACVPIRVPVATFRPSKSQRRVLRRNPDVVLQARKPEATDETHALYRKYLQHQHPDPARDDSREAFTNWLYAGDVVDTLELRYTVGDRLVAVSIVDVCTRSVSAVYHFFDPDEADRSLGVFSVLAEIDWAAQHGIPYYYLGFWIEGCPTMHYKANYAPHELLRHGAWGAPGT